MANKFQVKRTTISGRTPNTTNSSNTQYIDVGELALNLTDRKMFSSNGTVSFEIGSNLTSVSVSTTGTFGGNVSVTGEITATGDITAFFSDDRLKNKLYNIPYPVEKVMSLNGFYYVPNDEAERLGYEKKLQIGVSAQEVHAILPEVTAPAPIDEQYLTVKYDKLVPLLIEAIKEQQRQIEELRELIKGK